MNIAEMDFPFPAAHAGNVFGQFDCHMKKMEKTLHVTLIFRDDKLKLIGSEKDCRRAKEVVDELLKLSERGNIITEQNVNYALSLSMNDKVSAMSDLESEIICHTVMGKPIKPKTKGQQDYVRMISDKMIVFGVGPAGTGKTYLAMAKAITAFKANEVNRIILTRPAIEAGEKLGFLPGDLQIAQLRVEYKKAAVLGDMIYPKLSKEADRIVVELCDEQAKPYAVLEFKEEI